MKKERIVRTTIVLLGAATLLIGVIWGSKTYVRIDDDPIALGGTETNEKVLIQQTADDLMVIPDKYNTGAKGKLTKIALGGKINNIQLVAGSGGNKNIIDFYYRNKSVEGTVEIENCDFSDYPVALYNYANIDRKIKVVFRNCKFSIFSAAKETCNITFEFQNCTMNNFGGSDATFDYCKFGDSTTDGINPYQNIEVKNSFISDMGSIKAEGESIHSDGTQMYGAKGIDVKNVTFENCRFEIPPVTQAGSTAGVNSCIMLQLEYSNAENLSFSDCIVNGGGYSIFVRSVKEEYKLKDVSLENIRVGCAKKYGSFYPRLSTDAKISNVSDTEQLYVASVWKKEGKTHFSVSNDTNQDRTLLIVTDTGEHKFTIPKCKQGSQMTLDDQYVDMPFDLDIVLNEDSKFAVCYEYIYEGYETQIRFVNWTKKPVYLELNHNQSTVADDVLISGKCGADITYYLEKNGVLTLQGSGKTYSYNSAKKTPWKEYEQQIKEVRIEDGISELGTQLFRGVSSIKKVTLPKSLVNIGTRCFEGCTGLTSVTFPENLEKIGEKAFPYIMINNLYYEGITWENIEIPEDETWISEKVIMLNEMISNSKNENTIVQDELISEGNCGKDVTYQLTTEGILYLKGCGGTYHYNSAKTAPWYDEREKIKEVKVEEGITSIGNQLFRNCGNLESVTLPDGVTEIGANAFISCKSLKNINFPKSLMQIKDRAFQDTKLESVDYDGSQEEWDNITIGTYNEKVIQALKVEKM